MVRFFQNIFGTICKYFKSNLILKNIQTFGIIYFGSIMHGNTKKNMTTTMEK